MKREVCNQCKKCAVENTAILGCADDDCRCHTIVIGKEPISYQEGSIGETQRHNPEKVIYEPVEGEKVEVVQWVRYPSYDFIFGVPAKDSPKYEKEVGFFQFRDTRQKKVKQGFYIDVGELLDLCEGFEKILGFSKEHSVQLWQKHNMKESNQ